MAEVHRPRKNEGIGTRLVQLTITSEGIDTMRIEVKCAALFARRRKSTAAKEEDGDLVDVEVQKA